MMAALEITPELQAAIDAVVEAKVNAQLALVVSSPASADGLSMLPASIRRRECERRKAALRRTQEIGGSDRVKSTKPESVRRRKSEQKAASARRSDRSDRSPMDLAPSPRVWTANGAPSRNAAASPDRGPLAEHLAGFTGGASSSYAESDWNRKKAWLYREGAKIIREETGLVLPERWSTERDWKAATILLANWSGPEILKAVRKTCQGWTPSEKYPRPTLGLVLYRLRRRNRPVADKRPDSRRLTGEELEERARAAAAAAPPTKDPRTATSAPTNREPDDQAGRARLPTPGAAEAAVRPAGSGGCAAGIPSPAPPIGPRDLRGTPRKEVRGKIAEILEQLDAAKSRQGDLR